MKYLLSMLYMFLLTSCGTKDQYGDNVSGTFGVTKQQVSYETVKVDTNTTEKLDNNESCEMCFIVTDKIPVKSASKKSFKWYYTIPFIGLAITTFLVYRLKQQNMKSL